MYGQYDICVLQITCRMFSLVRKMWPFGTHSIMMQYYRPLTEVGRDLLRDYGCRNMRLLSRYILETPPFPFGRICFVVLVMRKGGKSS